MKQFFNNTLSSLKNKNYRLYYISQIISYSGTFLQALAQDWLVLKMTNSGTMLGLVLFFQFFPMLILTFYGGLIADRVSKLKLLFITQSISGLLALGLGLLVITGTVQIWMVFAFALSLGIINCLDSPTRQSFVFEMVGKDDIKNAVSIWVILISLTRILGPALAGILIATVGLGPCFIINAISFIPPVVALFFIDKSKLHRTEPVPKKKGQIKEALLYVKNTPVLFNTLLMMAIIGTLTFEWQASIPLFAKFVLNGDAGTYAIILVSMSIGMMVGGFFNASTKGISYKKMIISAFLFGVSLIIVSFFTNLIIALIIFGIVGIFSVSFANITQSILQVNTDPQMRGRVMSLWTITFFGSTAIGGPLIGWVGEVFGAKYSLIVGGVAAIIAAIIGYFLFSRNKPKIETKPELVKPIAS